MPLWEMWTVIPFIKKELTGFVVICPPAERIIIRSVKFAVVMLRNSAALLLVFSENGGRYFQLTASLL